MSERQFVENAAQVIADARALLSSYVSRYEAQQTIDGVEGVADLLERSRQSAGDVNSEPVRTIHHFACTGGTLITKCLASMPNTQVLSEVDPFSDFTKDSARRFFPTDLIMLARVSTRGADDQLVREIFVRGMAAIYHDTIIKGQRLVVRDHTHSHFCIGPQVCSRPTLGLLIQNAFPCISVVFVRHPLDSFLSLYANGWIHFLPGTLEEYCRRYMRFLDSYPETKVFRYEDFVARPEGVMHDMCAELQIPYDSAFTDTFFVHQLSGDSGRKGDQIGLRPRRSIPVDVDVKGSKAYLELCNRLRYDPNYPVEV